MSRKHSHIRTALQSGGRELSRHEVHTLPPGHMQTAVAAPQGSNLPGAYCTELPCKNGKKIVIYRDDTGGCTRYVEEDC